ncbi:uncharacterized protein LOC114516184 [Dendronephthya gigantea]|uniref:uncharacterized protein LOC114516184 n=1 Tax=Dendronephthya gigantea TaxID=151771 RepID=UPI00106B0A32|nr:uncharacterized protein LOC114516184 [Dendronephthya gigantea]
MMPKVFLLQLILSILAVFQDATCKVSTAHSKERSTIEERSTIFDSRVLNKVRTLFTQSVQTLTRSPTQTGQKKSIISTVDSEKPLHLKIDPRQFGNALLNQANENAARKSDIYMNKAIDATALGVAVLKLIFGKDAKMVMKDTKSVDTKADLRTKEARPRITSWTGITQNADRKSLNKNRKFSSKGSDGVGKLSMDILELVKSFQPSNSGEKSTQHGETKSAKENMASQDKEEFRGSESNLERLFSLLKESTTEEEKGDKKSWVLLKVPSKQPQDELGMLTDPAATESDNNDNDSKHEDTKKVQENKVKKHHKKKAKLSHTKQSNRRLLTKIQHQVKQLAHLVNKQDSQGRETSAQKHQKLPETPQQSYEGKSFTTLRRVASKTLKSEPLQEVNAVKTDTTSYENSVRNLLKALENSAHKHSIKSVSHVSKYEDEGRKMKPRHRKIDLVPLKNMEEQASSKDLVSGANTPGGAVVSLDALRQLGSLLGLSSPKRNEKRISPYTGTEDTLTLATPMPPTPTPTPTVPPAPAVAPSVQYNTNQQNSLARISEQLKMFAERGLRSHNDYRKLHHAEPLKWSEDLASAAEKLAYQAAKRGSARRSELVEKKGYGENVAKIPNIALENAGEEATRHWYNEKQNFTFSDPVVDEGTKAFTQIIWKGTETLGMGAAKDDDTGELYVVALYNPKGNEQETLRENLASDGEQHSDVYASIFKKSFPARHV